MVNFIAANIGNIIALTVVALLIFFAIRSIVKDKKSGKSSCGCNCAGCAMSGSCHSKAKN